jgi:hypothetical protein
LAICSNLDEVCQPKVIGNSSAIICELPVDCYLPGVCACGGSKIYDRQSVRHPNIWTLIGLHCLELPFQGSSTSSRFNPSGISKNGESEGKKSNEVVGEIVGFTDRSPEPATNRTPAFGVLIMIGATICAVLGFGLIVTGAHLSGILFVAIAIFGFWLPYHLDVLNRRPENIVIEPIVVSELEPGNKTPPIVGAWDNAISHPS